MSNSKLVRVGISVIVAAALALGVSACGGSSESSSDPSIESTATSTTASSVKGAPVKVAVFVNASGQNNGGQGAVVPVLEAWAEEANANGGVADHPVEFVVKDTKGTPPQAEAAAREVIGDDSIVAAVITDASNDGADVAPLSKGGVPVVGGGIGINPSVWGTTPGNDVLDAPQLANVFGIATSFPAYVAPILDGAREAGLHNFAIVGEGNTAGSKAAQEVFEAKAPVMGLKWVGGFFVDPSAPNFTATCLAVQQADADVMGMTMPDSTEMRLTADCETQGFSGAFSSSGPGVSPAFTESLAAGQQLVGGLYGFPWYVDSPPVERYRDAMEEHGVDSSDWARDISTASWATMELFKKALDANAGRLKGTITRQGVLDAYHTVKNETLEGMLPQPVTYTKGKPATPPACYWLFSYEDGEFSGSFEPTCPKPAWGFGHK